MVEKKLFAKTLPVLLVFFRNGFLRHCRQYIRRTHVIKDERVKYIVAFSSFRTSLAQIRNNNTHEHYNFAHKTK